MKKILSIITVLGLAAFSFGEQQADVLSVKSGKAKFMVLQPDTNKGIRNAPIGFINAEDRNQRQDVLTDANGLAIVDLAVGRYVLELGSEPITILDASVDGQLQEIRLMPERLAVGGAEGESVTEWRPIGSTGTISAPASSETVSAPAAVSGDSSYSEWRPIGGTYTEAAGTYTEAAGVEASAIVTEVAASGAAWAGAAEACLVTQDGVDYIDTAAGLVGIVDGSYTEDASGDYVQGADGAWYQIADCGEAGLLAGKKKPLLVLAAGVIAAIIIADNASDDDDDGHAAPATAAPAAAPAASGGTSAAVVSAPSAAAASGAQATTRVVTRRRTRTVFVPPPSP